MTKETKVTKSARIKENEAGKRSSNTKFECPHCRAELHANEVGKTCPACGEPAKGGSFKKVKEGIAFLIEDEFEKAELMVAAEAIPQKLQSMAEDLAKIEANDVMPMQDKLRDGFGPEAASQFTDTIITKVRELLDAVKNSKDAIDGVIAGLKGGTMPSNDMGSAVPPAAPDMGGLPPAGDDLSGDPMDAAPEANAPEEGGFDDIDIEPEEENVGAAGRAKKESATRRGRALSEQRKRLVNALRESSDPDAMILGTFRAMLRQTKSAGLSMRRIAEAFQIDESDVLDVVRRAKRAVNEADAPVKPLSPEQIKAQALAQKQNPKKAPTPPQPPAPPKPTPVKGPAMAPGKKPAMTNKTPAPGRTAPQATQPAQAPAQPLDLPGTVQKTAPKPTQMAQEDGPALDKPAMGKAPAKAAPKSPETTAPRSAVGSVSMMSKTKPLPKAEGRISENGQVRGRPWKDTPQGERFISSADSRQTSPEIMRAIAFFADNQAEAEALWNGDGFGKICHPSDMWENVTKNGLHDASEFYWGSAGSHWWDDIKHSN